MEISRDEKDLEELINIALDINEKQMKSKVIRWYFWTDEIVLLLNFLLS